MLAVQKTKSLRDRLIRNGINICTYDVDALRRAEKTLTRWSEQECGGYDDYKSWAIERDEETGKPYMAVYPHQGRDRRDRIPDRERVALARVKAVCDRNGLHYYHQTDPRGCALYVSREKLDCQNYSSRGVACCVE